MNTEEKEVTEKETVILPQQKVSIEGVSRFTHLALLDQSMSFMSGFTATMADSIYKYEYDAMKNAILKRGRTGAKAIDKSSKKHAQMKKDEFLNPLNRLQKECAKQISKYTNSIDKDTLSVFNNYSQSLGIVALNMVKMDNPSKAIKLIELYNEGMFKKVFETIEGIENQKTKEDA